MGKRGDLIYGVGINDSDYPTIIREKYYEDGVLKTRTKRVCKFFSRWQALLQRCYSAPYKATRPTYDGCYVCEDWLTFSKFKAWMETQDWEGKELDKDLLIKGNKLYSPETCVYLEPHVNSFLTESQTKQGRGPSGTVYYPLKDLYKVTGSSSKEDKIHLGYFKTAYQAQCAWLEFKLKRAHLLAESISDTRIATALIRRYEEYELVPEDYLCE